MGGRDGGVLTATGDGDMCGAQLGVELGQTQ